MHCERKDVLLLAMPFAGTAIPSIQLPLLEGYLQDHDIKINSRHLYLKAAEFYGLTNYNALIYPPNDSYSAQMAFSKYVFPQYWNNSINKIKQYFIDNLAKKSVIKDFFTFESYVQQTDKFYNWVIENIDWASFDLIGFTLNYGQILPSLAIAKRIKEIDPQRNIVFGGSRITEKMGIKVLGAFDYVDFIISGDGEDVLYLLASDYQNYESIPGLMYRSGKEIKWNEPEISVDLNSLPMLSHHPFYTELSAAPLEIQQYYQYFGRLPLEISRGCWWNKCTFCNLNIQCMKYREKDVDKIVEEIQFLSDTYQMLNFQIIGNTLPKRDFRDLCEKIIRLGRDFSFFAEARAGQLKSEDYSLLKKAGFSAIQTGVESFSKQYLKKMNKGVRVIDNIAALKFCKENSISNKYNIIVNYPNEDRVDFEETVSNVNLIKQYLDIPHICQLRVLYGSPIFNNPDKFNIKSLIPATIDKILFPKEYLDKEFNFVYDFRRKEERKENNWDHLVDEWKREQERLTLEGRKRGEVNDRLIFYFVDGGTFLKIFDKRNAENIKIYVLDEDDREIFLSCVDIISYNDLQNRFSDVPDYQLAAILHTFEQNGIVFREDDSYLALPLRYSQIIHKLSKRESEQVLYSSDIKRNL